MGHTFGIPLAGFPSPSEHSLLCSLVARGNGPIRQATVSRPTGARRFRTPTVQDLNRAAQYLLLRVRWLRDGGSRIRGVRDPRDRGSLRPDFVGVSHYDPWRGRSDPVVPPARPVPPAMEPRRTPSRDRRRGLPALLRLFPLPPREGHSLPRPSAETPRDDGSVRPHPESDHRILGGPHDWDWGRPELDGSLLPDGSRLRDCPRVSRLP